MSSYYFSYYFFKTISYYFSYYLFLLIFVLLFLLLFLTIQYFRNELPHLLPPPSSPFHREGSRRCHQQVVQPSNSLCLIIIIITLITIFIIIVIISRSGFSPRWSSYYVPIVQVPRTEEGWAGGNSKVGFHITDHHTDDGDGNHTDDTDDRDDDDNSDDSDDGADGDNSDDRDDREDGDNSDDGEDGDKSNDSDDRETQIQVDVAEAEKDLLHYQGQIIMIIIKVKDGRDDKGRMVPPKRMNFQKKIETAFGPPPHLRKIILRILQQKYVILR